MRKHNNETGSTSLMAAVIMASGVTLLLLNADMIKSTMKAKEISQQMAIGNAQQSNLSAISYLHACLEDGPTSDALLKVTDNKISGTGNKLIQIVDGHAIYKQAQVSTLNTAQIGQFFSGNAPVLAQGNSSQTQLDILETTKAGHSATYVVQATTTAKQGDKQYAPVKLVGRIKVNEVPSDPAAGQEEVLDCVTCVARAQELTLTIGYVGDITKTRNFGFYKVSAALDLCDVHFLKDMSDRIEDHDGKTSVLKTQVAMYCPCTCGWAR